MRNCNVAVREWEDQVVFLHKILPGAADKSYGIHVARLAGVPRECVERAKQILAQLENEHLDGDGDSQLARIGAEIKTARTCSCRCLRPRSIPLVEGAARR